MAAYDENEETTFDDLDDEADASGESDFSEDEYDDSETDDAELLDEDIDVPLPLEYGINFKTGRLTGAKVEGAEAVKVWAWNALLTERGAFEQYTENFGDEIPSLIGTIADEDEIKSDVKRMVRDCLEQNEYISGISNFTCAIEETKVTAAFTINTVFGDVYLDGVQI
jgi:hypothetical protein